MELLFNSAFGGQGVIPAEFLVIQATVAFICICADITLVEHIKIVTRNQPDLAGLSNQARIIKHTLAQVVRSPARNDVIKVTAFAAIGYIREPVAQCFLDQAVEIGATDNRWVTCSVRINLSRIEMNFELNIGLEEGAIHLRNN